ncbi:MAG: LuxR family transcriptional regulator, partial [Slackia sp.]|nr:LuxR family transcriptional regulator [Slackia sp.]
MTDDIDARNRAHAWKAPWATPFFAPFLGLAATRVWMQCTFFGAYAQSDAGTLTIVNQLFYGLAMLIGALIALKHPATPGARRAVSFAGTFLMTVGSILILLGSSSSNMGILLVACILAGIGGALGGAMWIEAYIRLDLRRCILYAFLSLALGSFGGLVLSFAPVTTMLAAGMLMPALSLLCHQRAVRIDIGTPPEPKPVFDAEPISTALIIVGGLAAFGFALGVARGFPLGQPVQLDVPERMVHQLGVIAVSLFIIWWSLVKN